MLSSLLGHTHQHLTAFRKDAQRYALPRDFKDVCNVEASDSKFLYGDDIKKSLREAKEDKRLTYSQSLQFDNSPKRQKTRPFLGQRKPSGFKQRGGRYHQYPQHQGYRACDKQFRKRHK
ncbi:hypothetical protein ElyMa_003037900 [Elysia marginata]|uniref:Uncharacterized protein n=1 Tax=Elysia marginata TaxID=1093978 RepID=A0AAV4IKZ9_9GAST|nr:hypothetical protein ElyMa_003037900 [Elysia marginata]